MSQKTFQIGAIGLGGESVFLSVDHFHAPGETVQAETLFLEMGGKAYNQAIAASRLGARVIFLGAIGEDANGEQCRKVLLDEGVTPVLQTVSDDHTAYACILTNRAGENQVTVSRGSADRLSASFILQQEQKIAQCSSLLLGLECPIEATLAALKLAKKHRVRTIFNPAPAVPLDFDLLGEFDWITPNLQEAMVLLGMERQPDLRELTFRLRKAHLVSTVVTLGGQGSLLVTEKHAYLFPSLPVTAVDTTGAGDTFNAALAVALSRNSTIEHAIEYATNASAYSVCRHHVLASLPTENDLSATYQTVQAVPVE